MNSAPAPETSDSLRSPCESCGMPIESGRYCEHCTDADGRLQDFDVRFERMVGWQARRNPDASRDQLEAETLAYLATMPAWRDHPRVTSRPGA